MEVVAATRRRPSTGTSCGAHPTSAPARGPSRSSPSSSACQQAPLRIEAYDISNLGPTDKVASMVVFEDGLPKRSDYRRFEIKEVQGQDDFASMEEVLRRRFARLQQERGRGRPAARERRGSRYPPALVVVDGGRGPALGWPTKVLADVGLPDPGHRAREAARGGLLPGQPEPLVIPRGSEALFVLQHIRDEAHRFAITYHRQKREKRALRLAARRHPGRGPGPQEGAPEAVRVARAAPGGRARTSSRRRPGIGPRWPA